MTYQDDVINIFLLIMIANYAQVLRYLENYSAANAWRVGKLTFFYLLVVHWIGCALVFILTFDGDLEKEAIEKMDVSEKFELYISKAVDAFHVRNPFESYSDQLHLFFFFPIE